MSVEITTPEGLQFEGPYRNEADGLYYDALRIRSVKNGATVEVVIPWDMLAVAADAARAEGRFGVTGRR